MVQSSTVTQSAFKYTLIDLLNPRNGLTLLHDVFAKAQEINLLVDENHRLKHKGISNTTS